MAKQTKPFIVEIKNARRKSSAVSQKSSIWGGLAFDLKRGLAEVSPPSADEPCLEAPFPRTHGEDSLKDDQGTLLPAAPRSDFLNKWASKKAQKPNSIKRDAVASFVTRIERQKALLAQYRQNPADFTKWRSAWFRKAGGGFGVSVGRGTMDAGNGLQYVSVDTVEEVDEFLDDLIEHARTDARFKQTLEQRHITRTSRGKHSKAASSRS